VNGRTPFTTTNKCGCIPEFTEKIPRNLLATKLVATGRMRALLQPVAATSEKGPESLFQLAGAGDWPPYQQV